MSPGVHNQLSKYPRRSLLLQKSRINDGDALQSNGESLSEGEELQINFGELNVEFFEVRDIFSEHLFHEVGLHKLVLEGVLVAFEETLEGVQTDLVLLHVGVD